MKVLIVGLGSIAKKHISALLRINLSIEIFALRSGYEASVEVGVMNIYDIAEARAIDFDFIIISTPTYLHHENIEQLISFGKPLFIEKPLANSLDIRNVLPLISKSNIKTYVGCNLRFLKVLNYVKNNYLNSDYRINEVNSYCGSYLPEWRGEKDFRKSYSASTLKGGGVHLDLIHEVDYIYWFFGKPLNAHKLLKSNSSLDIESVDFANYKLDYGDFVASITLNYYRRDAKRTFEVVTDKCTVSVDLLGNKVFENDLLVYESGQKIQETYEDQLRWFIDNLQTRTINGFNDIYEAYEVLKISLI